ncbi:hypothetical protein JVT61DRAFT_10485 [Boletus reticuloceps]|uniref:Uncharacterized protein n=1 Tax=Boletus reticuloceps TaxID=495285 RepID=A0A8I2YXQ6_9AGAM|nr:hypothetical protein JVT61DRAFT_10485 [Boletus reticuloceps]
MTIDSFPNLYFVHGPQGPAPCNAPTCVETQGSWVIQTIEYLRQHGITKFTPTSHAALTYKRHIDSLFNATLFPLTKSLNNGANVAEKEDEAYNYFGGVSVYKQEIMEEIERGGLLSFKWVDDQFKDMLWVHMLPCPRPTLSLLLSNARIPLLSHDNLLLYSSLFYYMCYAL